MHEQAGDEAMAELATRLFDMARHGETVGLDAYVVAGVPVNLCNDSGDTLLMLAAYHGHADTVAALLARGVDADRANDRGQSPLAGVVFKGEDAVVHALLDAGADPLAGTPSAVDTARIFGREDYVRFSDTFPVMDTHPDCAPSLLVVISRGVGARTRRGTIVMITGRRLGTAKRRSAAAVVLALLAPLLVTGTATGQPAPPPDHGGLQRILDTLGPGQRVASGVTRRDFTTTEAGGRVEGHLVEVT